MKELQYYVFPPMSHIFISYSRRDSETVDKITTSLQQAGFNVWIDREDIQTGNSWRVQIVEAIDTCDAFVLVLSGNSVISENVQKEVILAADSHRKIMVVMLEPVKVPAEIRYPLAGLQFVDVAALGFEKSMEQLISALKEHQKKIRPDGENTNKQIELVIKGVDLSAFSADKQEQLLAFIANLANTDRSQLNIASMKAGSVHVFIEMPAATAFLLKTLALNSDNHFAQLSIVSLKIISDELYVHVANGKLLPYPIEEESQRRNILLFIITLIVLIIIYLCLSRGLGAGLSSTTTEEPASPLSEPAQATANDSPTPTPTSTPTATPAKPTYQVLSGIISNERSACNYGPGSLYLNNETLRQGTNLQVLGRDINSTWAYVQADDYPEPCWVDLNNIALSGMVEDLEPVYPGAVALPPSDYWPAPANVYSARSKSDPDKLSIYWDEFILADGDLEGPGAPRYLLELWLCKNGTLTFTPIFATENNIVVEDEAGCTEPSSGVIYLAEKHGYPGPVVIPWEKHP